MKPHQLIAGEYIVKYKEFMIQKCDIENPTSCSHLAWMLWQIRDFIEDDNKANRWLGFVQGVMSAHNMIDIKEESERTRKYFNDEGEINETN